MRDLYINSKSRHSSKGLEFYLENLIGEKFRKYRKIWREVHDLKKTTDFPLYISLETQRKCNLRCSFCSFRDGEESTPGYYKDTLQDDLYKKIINEIKENYCPSMGFNVLNEPLLDKTIADKIYQAHKAGIIDSRVNTNANALTEKTSKKLIDSGLVRLSVSLDAFTKETYEKNRINSNYEKVLRNINQFLELRDKLNSKLPILKVTFVKIKENINEAENFENYWLEIADEVSFQKFQDPLVFNPDNEKKVFNSNNDYDDYACPQPNERLIIMGNGDVAPCCSQSNNLLKMGNLNQNSIKEIWDSLQYKNLQSMMRNKEWYKNNVCKACIQNLQS